MRLPQACFNSPSMEASRIVPLDGTRYIARMYKYENGAFEIRYTRQTKKGTETEAHRCECEGFDDWISV